MTVKASDLCDGTRTVTFFMSHLLFDLYFFYHNFKSGCIINYIAEIDIPVVTCYINLHDVLLQLHRNFNGTNNNHVNPTQFLGFDNKKIV